MVSRVSAPGRVVSEQVRILSTDVLGIPNCRFEIARKATVGADGKTIIIPGSMASRSALEAPGGMLILRGIIVHELSHIKYKNQVDRRRERTLRQLFKGPYSSYLALITWYTYYESEAWLDRTLHTRYPHELRALCKRQLVRARRIDIESRLMNAAAISVLGAPSRDQVCNRIADDWRAGRIGNAHLQKLLEIG